jgi:hypothetical protein
MLMACRLLFKALFAAKSSSTSPFSSSVSPLTYKLLNFRRISVRGSTTLALFLLQVAVVAFERPVDEDGDGEIEQFIVELSSLIKTLVSLIIRSPSEIVMDIRRFVFAVFVVS